MYAKIVVLTYQPPEPGYFTYKIPTRLKVKPGHLVKVPFGKREPIGLVISTSPIISNFKFQISNLKTLSELVLPNPLFPPHLLDLLKWMSDYYFAPLVNCLEAMMPEIPRKWLIVNSSSGENNFPMNDKPSTINQTIILVPTINQLPETMAKYPMAKNPIQYHNQLKASEKFANWMKILNGQTDFIFGSRSAIFAPAPNLKKIIVHDEHDGAFKDERSPYYDTLTIAQKISQLTKAKIEIIDKAPKVTTFHRVQPWVRVEPCPKTQKTFIIDMARERQMGNFTHLSGLLEDFIKRNYKKGGKTLLFLNKKVESGQFYCKNCSNQGFFKARPFACPKCQSKNFYFYTTNLFTLANEVKKLVDITPKLIAEDKTFRPHYSPSLIDITTSYIFYAQTFAKYQLAAHIAADSTLNRPVYHAPENFYAQIQNLKSLLIEKGVLVVQTYNPDNPTIKTAASGNYKAFYENELKVREQLKYPPFVIFVKIIGHAKDKEKVLQSTKKLAENIKRQNLDGLTVLGPIESRPSRGEARYSIILKKELKNYELPDREMALVELHDVISLAKKDFQVIVEPEGLD